MANNNSGNMMTKGNYEILRAMLTGKYLRGSMTNEKLDQLEKDVGYGNFSPTVKKLEEMGVVTGYVPVLSEKGKRLLEAMKLIYGPPEEKDATVEELLEPM